MREAGTSEKCQVEQARTRRSRALRFAVDHGQNGGKMTA